MTTTANTGGGNGSGVGGSGGAVGKDCVNQQKSESATDISGNNNNNNLSRCPNEFTSPNNLNGLPNNRRNGSASK